MPGTWAVADNCPSCFLDGECFPGNLHIVLCEVKRCASSGSSVIAVPTGDHPSDMVERVSAKWFPHSSLRKSLSFLVGTVSSLYIHIYVEQELLLKTIV
jgi:hypothetical protein